MRIIDLHCDTILWSLFKEGDPLENEERQVSRDKLKAGQALAQCFALFVPNGGKGSVEEQEQACYEMLQKLEQNYRSCLAGHSGWLAPAVSAADIQRNCSAGKISSVLTLEDGTFVAGQMGRLDEVAAMGAKALALTWNTENCFGYPNSPNEKAHQLPLKSFGRAAIEHMNELGILVDVSHLNEGGFWDVAQISKRPFLATHSCARSLVNHSRNLTDDQIRAIANAGGVVGVNFYPTFIAADGKTTTIETVLQQLQYLVKIGGEDVAAFGSDFDGIPDGELTFGGYEGYAAIAEALYSAVPARIADKICHQNALRMLAL